MKLWDKFGMMILIRFGIKKLTILLTILIFFSFWEKHIWKLENIVKVAVKIGDDIIY